MKRLLTVAFVLCASAAAAAPGDYYLYAPQPAGPDTPVTSGPDGIFVKEITIRKGDTLSDISRAFNGRASFFPQILLFNRISDPDLIYAGKTLRVPVAYKAPKERDDRPAPRAAVREEKRKSPAPEPKQQVEKKEAAPVVRPPVQVEQREKDDQVLYQRAVRAYKGQTCEDALPLLDEFLRKYQGSAMAPDAALMRADCHLRLSGQ